jgi:hypothetical protein
MSALKKARELERWRKEILAEGEALQKAIAAFKELRELVDEQLKAIQGPASRA